MKKFVLNLIMVAVFTAMMVGTIVSGFDAYDKELQIQENKVESHFEMIAN